MAAVKVIRIAAAALVDDSGQMLLVRKRGTSAFMQPGGKIDAGETPLAALARELREELTLDIDVSDATYLGHFHAIAANEAEARVEAEMFGMKLSGAPRAGAEIEELRWYPRDFSGAEDLAPLTRDHVIPACMARQS